MRRPALPESMTWPQWQEMVRRVNLEGKTLQEAGTEILALITQLPGELGEHAFDLVFKRAAATDFSTGGAVSSDLLPLPVTCLSAEDVAREGEDQGAEEMLECFKQRGKQEGFYSWVTLQIIYCNFMNGGGSTSRRNRGLRIAYGPATTLQVRSIALLHRHAAFTLAPEKEIPARDWGARVGSSRLSYSGEAVSTAVPLTWEQVEPALPPKGLAGEVPAELLYSDGLRPWLTGPRKSILPISEWPDSLKRAQTRAEPEEWLRLVKGTAENGITDYIPEEEVIVHNGLPLVSAPSV